MPNDNVLMPTPLLMIGSRGKDVERLQTLLKVTADGVFGSGTQKAVIAFQREHNLVADGIVGDRTWRKILNLFSSEDSKALTEDHLIWASSELGCEVKVLKAISEVESSGYGFIDTRPKILFERHLMARFIRNDDLTTLLDLASTHLPNIVNTTPGGYVGGKGEWERFNTACGLHRSFAIEATSWGRYQILGMHWKRLGLYKDAECMMQKMHESEYCQLMALVRFIETDKRLWDAVRSKDWATFARIYNGPKHLSYDKKMEAAYNRLVNSGTA